MPPPYIMTKNFPPNDFNFFTIKISPSLAGERDVGGEMCKMVMELHLMDLVHGILIMNSPEMLQFLL